MSALLGLGTYVPVWEHSGQRVVGPDEDAVTMAVAAGRALLDGLREDAQSGREPDVRRVVFVSRDLPLLEGGSGAALLAGLGVPAGLPVVEQVGGGPSVLELIATAEPGTLVLAADLEAAGAGAALVGSQGTALDHVGRVTGSLPTTSRGRDGVRWNYDDSRLMFERGTKAALADLDLADKPDVIAGLGPKPTRQLSRKDIATLPTTGASSAIFALAEAGSGDVVVATEQASAVAVSVAGVAKTFRDEAAAPLPVPRTRTTPGPDIGISLPAYDRAFDSKLRWEAGSCNACGNIAMPPRLRCTRCGSEEGWSLAPLPRSGEVYTKVDIHVPVPGRATPYSLAIVQLDNTEVRTLVTVTGAPSGALEIGDRGRLVLRRIDTRSGVPDYGHALRPDVVDDTRGDMA